MLNDRPPRGLKRPIHDLAHILPRLLLDRMRGDMRFVISLQGGGQYGVNDMRTGQIRFRYKHV
jgi:hypothetical protein